MADRVPDLAEEIARDCLSHLSGPGRYVSNVEVRESVELRLRSFLEQRRPTEAELFRPKWPEGVESGEFYRVPCDDKGRNGGSWLQVMVSPSDGDVHVSMQDWERMPEGEPSPFPSLRCRTGAGGGRNHRTRQALLWLARAIQLDAEEAKARGGWS